MYCPYLQGWQVNQARSKGQSICCLLLSGYLFVIIFEPEDVVDMSSSVVFMGTTDFDGKPTSFHNILKQPVFSFQTLSSWYWSSIIQTVNISGTQYTFLQQGVLYVCLSMYVYILSASSLVAVVFTFKAFDTKLLSLVCIRRTLMVTISTSLKKYATEPRDWEIGLHSQSGRDALTGLLLSESA